MGWIVDFVVIVNTRVFSYKELHIATRVSRRNLGMVGLGRFFKVS